MPGQWLEVCFSILGEIQDINQIHVGYTASDRKAGQLKVGLPGYSVMSYSSDWQLVEKLLSIESMSRRWINPCQ